MSLNHISRIVSELMDYDERYTCGFSNVFRSFVCLALSLLLGLHLYTYLWGNQESIDSEFGDIKYVVMQLTQGLSEVISSVKALLCSGLKGLAVVRVFTGETRRNVLCFEVVSGAVALYVTFLMSKMNREHERIRNELERMTSSLPAMAAATGRVKDSLEPARRRQSLDIRDYDHQIADYALESAGARVLDTGETQEYVIHESSVGWALYFVSSLLCHECPGASVILRPGTLPGECWAFKGFRGEATIRLLGTVQITGVSVEHIPPHISPTREISSAPRLFQLEGLISRSDLYPHDFGIFEYDKEGKPIQYFEVKTPANTGYYIVRFKVHSNWGHPHFTCVYRVRIHGDLTVGQTQPKTISDEA